MVNLEDESVRNDVIDELQETGRCDHPSDDPGVAVGISKFFVKITMGYVHILRSNTVIRPQQRSR